MKRPREASATLGTLSNAPPTESSPPEDQVFFDQSLRTAVRGLGKLIRARRSQAPDVLGTDLRCGLVPRQPLSAATEDRISRVARHLAGQVDHTMRLENQAPGKAASQARVRRIEEQLRLTPSLVWTLPDDF